MPATPSYILITVVFRREDDVWTAECLELGTSAFGSSVEEAKEAVEDLIGLHLSTLEELGERERFFSDRGIKLHKVLPKGKSTTIKNVPIDSFIIREYRDLAPV